MIDQQSPTDALGLPEMTPEVARIFAEADPESIRRIARQMDYTRRYRIAAWNVADHIPQLLGDPGALLDYLRDSFTEIAGYIKVVLGDE